MSEHATPRAESRGPPDLSCCGLAAMILSLEAWCGALEQAEIIGNWATVEHIRLNMCQSTLTLRAVLECRGNPASVVACDRLTWTP